MCLTRNLGSKGYMGWDYVSQCKSVTYNPTYSCFYGELSCTPGLCGWEEEEE